MYNNGDVHTGRRAPQGPWSIHGPTVYLCYHIWGCHPKFCWQPVTLGCFAQSYELARDLHLTQDSGSPSHGLGMVSWTLCFQTSEREAEFLGPQRKTLEGHTWFPGFLNFCPAWPWLSASGWDRKPNQARTGHPEGYPAFDTYYPVALIISDV